MNYMHLIEKIEEKALLLDEYRIALAQCIRLLDEKVYICIQMYIYIYKCIYICIYINVYTYI